MSPSSSSPSLLLLLAAFLLFGGPAPVCAAEAVSGPSGDGAGGLFVFRLMPGDRVGEHVDEAELSLALPEGTVYLYRVGSKTPEVVAPANDLLSLPPGEWVWTAEAPGYASAATNRIRVPARPVQRDVRELHVSVVPACRLDLLPDERWAWTDRLDVVSLDLQAVYPVQPEGRRSLWIPAGRYLAYGVRAGRIQGMGAVESCRRDEERSLTWPEPPPGDRQGLLVQASTPEPLSLPSWAELEVGLEHGDGTVLRPDGVLWQGPRAAFFFVSVPADGEAELRLEHPELRSRRRVVEPSGGAVQEVAMGTLGRRKNLEVAVDYRPARSHREAVLELSRCGADPAGRPAALMAAGCPEPLATLPLEPGLRTYRFPGLDDGQYLLSATVDGEEVPGLGRDVAPWLDPDLEGVPPLGPFALEEMHVWGELRYDGRAVPGEVRLDSWAAGTEAAGTHPTDEDLLYHLYYFARLPDPARVERFPEALRDRDREELGGLYCCYTVTACAEAAGCRSFNRHSLFTGSGRFDLDLGEGTRVEVTVVDSVLGEPLAGAEVLVKPSPAFHFFGGEVEWFPPPGREPDSLRADGEGRVVLLPREAGRQKVYAMKEGYEVGSATTTAEAGGTVALRVELDPKVRGAGTRLVLPSGEPLSHARLRAFDGEGRGDPGCRTKADGEGHVELPEGCEDRLYLVLHPAAALEPVAGGRFAGARLEVSPRGLRPVAVRVVDAAGEPVAGALLELRLGPLSVTPDDLGNPALTFGAADEQGVVVLRGVDPAGDLPVSVAPWGAWQGEWTLLSESDRGAVVEVGAEPR